MGWHPFDTYMVVSILKLSYGVDDLGAPHFKKVPPEFGTKAVMIEFFMLPVLTMVFVKNILTKKKWYVATKSRAAFNWPIHLSASGSRFPISQIASSPANCQQPKLLDLLYDYMRNFWYFRFREAGNPAAQLASSHQGALAWKSCPGAAGCNTHVMCVSNMYSLGRKDSEESAVTIVDFSLVRMSDGNIRRGMSWALGINHLIQPVAGLKSTNGLGQS